jgi:hypothetical protein
MAFIRKMCCEIWQCVPRAAAAAGLAVALLSIAPPPVAAQAEDAVSSAEDAAATTATEQAASQAASEAASQAASQAASEAASRAANEAATRAANQAAAEAVAGASDRAATSISDQTATSVSDQAANQSTSSASERASESATNAAASTVSPDQSGRAAEGAGPSTTEQAVGSGETAATTAVSGETSVAQSSGAETETERESESGKSASGETSGENGQTAAVAAALDVVKGFDGSEVKAREVVVLLSKTDVPVVQKLDYKIIAQTSLDSLGGQLLRVRVPAGMTTEAALQAIELAAPGAVAAPNHVFRMAGKDGGGFWQPWRRKMAALWVRPAPRPGSATPAAFEGLVGVIDTPVDPNYPGLMSAVVATHSFADGTPASAAHGTAVAELISRQHVRVIAANVFARDEHGNAAATTDSILRALDWLVAHHATVINMSMEGPLDGALRAAIARAQAKGSIIVAAAGNKGPAAPPSYPGAFPAVVAVTAIDKNDQVYPYANQGTYISFAALGVDVETASPPDGKRVASGTSFAAPVVAALVARMEHEQTAQDARSALAHLVRAARHLGLPGRNPVFGYGALSPDVLTAD